MKLRLVTSLTLILGFLMVWAPLYAHHGNVAYDTSKAVPLKGATVTKFVWANPHVIVMFDMKDDKGNVLDWAGEAGSPAALGPLGGSSKSVQPGESVTVYIYQSKNGN